MIDVAFFAIAAAEVAFGAMSLLAFAVDRIRG
jgi:hypothetical protein